VTNGGRILNVTAIGDDLVAARSGAYDAVHRISFPGMRFREDIGLAAAEGHVRG
jgi:phosphoribosylamine--glycine ligase